MKIYVATGNQRKIDLVKKVFGEFHSGVNIEVLSCEISSDVSGTPQENDNFVGSMNRARKAKLACGDGDFFVGLETGLVERVGKIFEETWCSIVDKTERINFAFSSGNVVDELSKPKYVMDEEKGVKVLMVLDQEQGNYVQYSGSLEVRAVEIENAIRAALVQFGEL